MEQKISKASATEIAVTTPQPDLVRRISLIDLKNQINAVRNQQIALKKKEAVLLDQITQAEKLGVVERVIIEEVKIDDADITSEDVKIEEPKQ